MNYILFIFWYGSYAAQLQKVEDLTKYECQNMKNQIIKKYDGLGEMKILCIKKGKKK